MSRSDAARYADSAARVQDNFARTADFGRGRGYAWRADAEGFDSSTLPPRVTSIRRQPVPVSTPVARPAPTATRSNGRIVPTGERAPQVVRHPAPVVAPPPVVVVEKPALVEAKAPVKVELDAARTQLLATLRARQAVLESEEAVRQAAEAERIQAEAKAEQARRDAEDAELRKERERQAREEAVLRDERSQLIEMMRAANATVFSLLWPGQAFSREYPISWVRGLHLEAVRNTQRRLTDESATYEAAKARFEAERREAAATAAKLDPKSKGFNLVAHLKAKAADPVVPVRPPPSKEELAELERKVNGLPPVWRPSESSSGGGSGGKRGFRAPKVPTDIQAQASARELLEARIRALDAMMVTRVYQGNNTRWRWPNIEAMLAVPSDNEVNQKLSEFAGKVEHAMAKAKRKG